nr:hypothetical protein GCM10020093_068870 [Planobispora longispora]
MGEQPVEPDGHSQPGDHVEDSGQQQIVEREPVAPRQPDACTQRGQRYDDESRRQPDLEPARREIVHGLGEGESPS